MYQILKPKKWITVVKIPKNEISKIDVAMAKQPVETMSSFYSRIADKPDFIINGGLFFTKTGNTLSTTVDEGKTIAGGNYSNFGLETYKDNTFTFKNYSYTKDLKDFIGGSPSLIINGKINIDKKGLEKDKNLTDVRHPRSAIGMNDDYFFMVTIDGRQPGMPGMTVNELANFMFNDLKCTNAINLDGGGSTRLMQANKTLNSATENRACDNFVTVYLKKNNTVIVNAYIVTADKLNIRDNPNGKVIGSYSKGQTVTILQEQNGWVKTEKGWVSKNYLLKK